MADSRQAPLISQLNKDRRCHFPTIQQVARLKYRNVYGFSSAFADIAHTWLTIIFIIYYSDHADADYYTLIPFIPIGILGFIIALCVTALHNKLFWMIIINTNKQVDRQRSKEM
eukprot:64708_1